MVAPASKDVLEYLFKKVRKSPKSAAYHSKIFDTFAAEGLI